MHRKRFQKEEARTEGLVLVAGELRLYGMICLIVAVGGFDLIWALDPEHDLPALIQAVGTLVAIVLAIAVVDIQHKLEARTQERERSKQDEILRRALSIKLVPELRPLHERCNLARDRLSEMLAAPDRPHNLGRGKTQIEIPPFIDQTWHSLHVLGGKTSDRLLNACAQLAEMNKQFDAKFPNGVMLKANSEELGWIRNQRDHYARQSDDIGEVRKAIAEWAGYKPDT
jgi:hypothetical protein